MTLIPAISLPGLRASLPVLEDLVDEQMAAISPSVAILDCKVLPTALEARVRIEVSPAPRESVWGEFVTSNGVGVNAGTNYTAVAGAFYFLPDGPTVWEVVVPLKGNNQAGDTINVRVGSTIYGASIARQTAQIIMVDTLPDQAPGGYSLVYSDNLVDNFHATDTGLMPDGQPCWRTRFHFGRDQAGNKELGLYADADVFPGIGDPFPVVDGVRALRGQKFGTPVVYNGKTFAYGAAMLSSQRFMNDISTGNRIEVEAALPINGKNGLWPAIWLLPSNLAWPPEIDMMERPVFAGESPFWFYTTEHWPGPTSPQKKGYRIDTRALGATADTSGFHTYGLNIEADRLTFDYDGVTYAVIENRSPAAMWYLILNMAVGGSWPGMPYGGTKLPADGSFPADMLVRSLRVYSK
jgi:hypothetical protein